MPSTRENRKEPAHRGSSCRSELCLIHFSASAHAAADKSRGRKTVVIVQRSRVIPHPQCKNIRRHLDSSCACSTDTAFECISRNRWRQAVYTRRDHADAERKVRRVRPEKRRKTSNIGTVLYHSVPLFVFVFDQGTKKDRPCSLSLSVG